MVYQFTGPGADLPLDERLQPGREEAPGHRPAAAREAARTAAGARDEEPVEVLVA
jgi:hypothetical protein